MDRLACVDLPAFPLQLLLKRHPDWRESAVAVVAEDRPLAPLLYVNEAARRVKVLPGQKFATALGLARDLRAGTITAAEIDRGVAALADLLRRYSPHVEPAEAAPGVFFIDASGLERLYTSLRAWAKAVAAELRQAGFEATVVVGFTRYGVYAVAKSGRGTQVFPSPADETAAAARVALGRLDLDPEVRERLAALDVRTVGAFLRLPPGGIRRRFGADAHRLHRLATGDLWAPLVPVPPPPAHECEAEMETPESDSERLLFVLKRHLDVLLSELARRGEALVELSLHLRLDNGEQRDERLRPAAATLDGVQLLGLVRLRLESLQNARNESGRSSSSAIAPRSRGRLTSGVVDLRLSAEAVRASAEQIELFAQHSRRDVKAVSRAFARLRAELGDDVVVRARLQDAHLPSARFYWERLTGLPDVAEPRPVASRPLVRRLYEKPLALPPRPRQEPDGWRLRGFEHGHVERLSGPYVIAGGWWNREVHREYYFAHMSGGDVLWIYYDRRRRRFFHCGRVE